MWQRFLMIVFFGILGAVSEIVVDPASNHLIDELNRVRIYHGVNIVHKLKPYHPVLDGEFDIYNSLVEQDMLTLQSLGMNVVRLGVMWPAVEPERGQYNQTYLNVMRELVIKLGTYNISTIVDFHQDLLNGKYCGEGVPDYLMDMMEEGIRGDICQSSVLGWIFSKLGLCKSFQHDYQYEIDANTGYPSIKQCLSVPFGFYYPSSELSTAYDTFFNSPAIQDRMVLYFEKLAETFHDVPSVLGYDLFNEPFAGNVYQKLWLLQGGKADYYYLQPLYTALYQAISKYDQSKLIFYEPMQFPGTIPLLGGFVQAVGFTKDYNNSPASTHRNVLSYHLYCCASGDGVCDEETGNVKPDYEKSCDKYIKRKYDQRMHDITNTIGGGGFLTEFGACSNDINCIKEIERSANIADDYFQSWAYWQYKYNEDITTQSGAKEGFYHETDGSLQKEKVHALSRTYATAIAGKPLRMRYDTTTFDFELKYEIKANTGTQSEIYLNEAWSYPYGYNISLSNGTSIVDQGKNYLIVEHDSTIPIGTIVHVRITSK